MKKRFIVSILMLLLLGATALAQQWTHNRSLYYGFAVRGVAVAPDGRVWFDRSNSNILIVNPSTAGINPTPVTVSSIIYPGGTQTLTGDARGMYMGPDGKMYHPASDAIYVIDPTQTIGTTLTASSRILTAHNIAASVSTPASDKTGNIVVSFATLAATEGVLALNSAGVRLTDAIPPTTGLPGTLRDLALSPDGKDLYLTGANYVVGSTGQSASVSHWHSATGVGGTYTWVKNIGSYGASGTEVHLDQYGRLWIGVEGKVASNPYGGTSGRARFECWDLNTMTIVQTIECPIDITVANNTAISPSSEWNSGGFLTLRGFWLSNDGTKAYIVDALTGVQEYTFNGNTVSGSITGLPAGTEVTLTLTDNALPSSVLRLSTSAGTYSFPTENGKTYTLAVENLPAGYTYNGPFNSISGSSNVTQNIVATLVAGGTYNLTVTGLQTGATVRLTNTGDNTYTDVTTTGTTHVFTVDAGKSYRVTPVPVLGQYKFSPIYHDVNNITGNDSRTFTTTTISPAPYLGGNGEWQFSKLIENYTTFTQGVGVTADNNIWVNPNVAGVYVYDANGANRATISATDIGLTSTAGRGLNIGHDGRVYIVKGYRISSINPLTRIGIAADHDVFNTNPAAPGVDVFGNIVVTAVDPRTWGVYAYEPDVSLATRRTVIAPSNANLPTGSRDIAITPDGKHLYINNINTANSSVGHWQSANGANGTYTFDKYLNLGNSSLLVDGIHLDQYGRLWLSRKGTTTINAVIQCWDINDHDNPTLVSSITSPTMGNYNSANGGFWDARGFWLSNDGTKAYISESNSGTAANVGVLEYEWISDVPPQTYTLSGTITIGGSPFTAESVTVTLTDQAGGTPETTTTSTGSYSFTVIENHTYTVTTSQPTGYVITPSSRTVTNITDNVTTGADFIVTAVGGSYNLTITINGLPGGTSVPVRLFNNATGVYEDVTVSTGTHTFTVEGGRSYTVTPVPVLGQYKFDPIYHEFTIIGNRTETFTFVNIPVYPGGDWSFTRRIGPQTGIMGVALDHEDKIWVNFDSRTINVYNQLGSLNATIQGDQIGSPAGTSSDRSNGRGMSLGHDGLIYAAKYSRIGTVDPKTMAGSLPAITPYNGFEITTPVADVFGNIVVAKVDMTNNSDVLAYDKRKQSLGPKIYAGTTGLPARTRDLAITPDGKYLYINNIETGAPVTVWYSATGTAGTYTYQGSLNLGNNNARADGIHLDQFGRLWVEREGSTSPAVNAVIECWDISTNPPTMVGNITSPTAAVNSAVGGFQWPRSFWLSNDGKKAYIGEWADGGAGYVLEYELNPTYPISGAIIPSIPQVITMQLINNATNQIVKTVDIPANSSSYEIRAEVGNYRLSPLCYGYSFSPTEYTVNVFTDANITGRDFTTTEGGFGGSWVFSRVVHEGQVHGVGVTAPDDAIWINKYTDELLVLNQDLSVKWSRSNLGSENTNDAANVKRGRGLSVGQDGKIYTTYNTRVYRINPTGLNVEQTYTISGTGLNYGTTPVVSNAGDGNLLVAFSNHATGTNVTRTYGVERYTTAGAGGNQGTAAILVDNLGMPNLARDLAISSNGQYLYVACTDGSGMTVPVGVTEWVGNSASGTYTRNRTIGSYGSSGAEEVHYDDKDGKKLLWVGYNGTATRAARFDCWDLAQDPPVIVDVILSPVMGATVTPTEFTNGAFSMPRGFWLSTDGKKAYIGDFNRGVLEYIASLSISGKITIGTTSGSNLIKPVTIRLIDITNPSSQPVVQTTNLLPDGTYKFNQVENARRYRIEVLTTPDYGYSFAPVTTNEVYFTGDTELDFVATVKEYTISGTVTGIDAANIGPDGQLHANQTVRVTISPAPVSGLSYQNVADGGTYSFTVLGLEDYTITPSANYVYTEGPSVTFSEIVGNQTQNFTVNTRRMVSLGGTILKEDGTPVTDLVPVRYTELDGYGTVLNTTLDPTTGSYSFPVPAGTRYYIEPLTTPYFGYRFQPVYQFTGVIENDELTVDFTAILNTHTIEGVVYDGVTPLENAQVVISYTHPTLGYTEEIFTTAIDGMYRFENLLATLTYTLKVDTNVGAGANFDGFFPAQKVIVLRGDRLNEDDFLAITGGNVANITGYVRTNLGDAATGANNVSLHVKSNDPGWPYSTTISTDTEEGTSNKGYYRLVLPIDKNYTITPLTPETTPSVLDQGYVFEPGQTRTVSLDLNGLANVNIRADLNKYFISGTVWNGSVRLDGATLTITKDGVGFGAPKTSDANGEYIFDNLDALSTYTISVSKVGFSFYTHTKQFPTLIGNRENEDFYTAENAIPISGRITRNGIGVPYITVRVANRNTGSTVGSDVTDESGDYVVNVPADQIYSITPLTTPDQGYEFTPNVFNMTTPLTSALTVNFTASLKKYTISGRVTELDGTTPISGVRITCTNHVPGYTTTNSVGYYSFEVDARGTYNVAPVLAGVYFSPDYYIFGDEAGGLIGNRTANFREMISRGIISTTPNFLDFGNSMITKTVQRTIEIKNNGARTLTVMNIEIVGEDGNNFARNFTNVFTLEPDESRVITVSFTPTSVGMKSASFNIYHDAPSEDAPNPLPVVLTGTGVRTLAEIGPFDVVDFGEVILNSGDDTRQVVFYNNSQYGFDDILRLTDAYFENPTSVFGVTGQNEFPNRPITIAGGYSNFITVTFSPTEAGPIENYLHVINSSANMPDAIITVRANVLRGDLVVTPSVVDFGSLETGGYREIEVEIQNVSSTPIEIFNKVIVGDDGSFVLIGDDGVTLQPNQTDYLSIRFHPVSDGNKSGKLNIASNYYLAPNLSVPIKGVAGFPAIYTETRELDFGTLYRRMVKDTVLTIINDGVANLIISSATFIDANTNMFTVVSPARFPLIIRGGESYDMVIRATATLPNENKHAKLLLTNNDPRNRQYTIDLMAKVESAVLVMNINDNRIVFDSLTLGYHRDTVLTLRNEGDIACDVTKFEISGAFSSDFSMYLDEVPFTVEPGQTKEITIRFRPLGLGQRYAVLNITIDDPVNPNMRLTLQGWGIDAGAVPYIVFGDEVGTENELNFGIVPVRETKTKDMIIKNLSKYGTLRIDNIKIDYLDKQPFSFGNIEFPVLIDPLDSLLVTLSFRPDDKVREYNAFLAIQYSDYVNDPNPDDIVQVLLKGSVIFPGIGIKLPNVLEFGIVKQGDTLQMGFDITNANETYLTLDSIIIVGADASEFTLGTTASSFPIKLNQDEVYTLNVRWIAGNIGHKDARIFVYNTDLINSAGANEIVLIGESSLTGSGGTIGITMLDEIPTVYNLYQNYPNPFNPTTKIEYALPEATKVRLVVYNSLGQEVIKLVDEYQAVGKYRIDFDAKNLPSGIYFYRIQADKFTAVKKMMLLK